MLNDVGAARRWDTAAALAVIEGRLAMPFVWGSDANDCVSATAAVIRAHSGHDPIAGLFWSDEAQARAVIASLGGFEAAISSRLSPIEAAMAQRFDAAMVMMPEGPLLAIVEGDSLVGPGRRKQLRLPRHRMVRAWTVRGR
ncbi:DUF6950 family protein [Sphingomonas bisphenolicum]